MELTLKTLTLYGSIVLTGLSAGLFYAWSVSVIPGTQKVADPTYLETMQSINKAILNPRFFLIFFGSLILLSISSIYEFNSGKLAFWLMLAATVTYLFGTFGVTAMGNVPLNDELEALNLSDMSISKMTEFRSYYEQNWNRLHTIRTVFAVLSFMLSLAALLTGKNL